MNNLHLLRPLCLWLLLPALLLIVLHWKRKRGSQVWNTVCDAHLLPHLLCQNHQNQRNSALIWISLALSLLIFGLSGPSWVQLPVPSFQQVHPHIILLDMSRDMAQNDVSPTRLERAKFIIHDLLKQNDAGQFALIAYTAEPFVVAPLTEDGNTIDALLSSLDINIMPIDGHQLTPALGEAEKLLKQAGYAQGEILILSAHPPTPQAVDAAAALAAKGIDVSVMPLVADAAQWNNWRPLATEGQGLLLKYTNPNSAIRQWLALGTNKRFYNQTALDDIPLWKDEGRWFILAGTLMLLTVFRRGWLQRIDA